MAVLWGHGWVAALKEPKLSFCDPQIAAAVKLF